MAFVGEPGRCEADGGTTEDIDGLVVPLRFAEPNSTVAEFEAIAARRIYEAFLPVAVHVFTVAGLPPAFNSTDGRVLVRSLWAAAGAAAAERTVGHSVNPSGGQPMRLATQLDALRSVSDRSLCVFSSGVMHNLTILFVVPLQAGVSESHAMTVQTGLRELTDALIAEAENDFPRPERDPRLAALSAVLADIASQLEIDKVLEAIVAHARNLFGSDSAYLADVDEENRRVQMRVTVGIRDVGYKRSRLEFGKGLAGAIAASREIMFSSDYLADSRFVHTPDTDANMRREGMRSVLAAPLQVGDRIIGVLAVTNHYPTTFSPDDVQIVKSLADGAAIALENAQLYSQQMQLVDELRELNSRTVRQHEALKRSVRIHDQLMQIVLQDQGIDAIAGQLAKLVSNPVAVLDQQCRRLVVAGIDPSEADALCIAIAQDLKRLTGERRPIHLTAAPGSANCDSLLVSPIRAGTDLLGYIVVFEVQHPLEAPEFQTLEQAATVFALALTRARVIEEVEFRLRGDLVHDLVSGTFDQDTILKRARRLGHDLSSPQVILTVALDPPAADAAERGVHPRGINESVRILERSVRVSLHRHPILISAQTSIVDDLVVALIALPQEIRSAPQALEPLVRLLQTDLAAVLPRSSASIGMSRICTQPAALGRSYREARQALCACRRMGLRGHALAYERMGIERLLFTVLERYELADFVDSMLGPMIAYDKSHGTGLVSTLRCYLETGRRQREAADMLGVHVNSLSYRLRRIEDIGELSLDDAETCLNLHVAVRMLELQAPDFVSPS